MSELPTYTLRVSKRAKRVTLKISAAGRLSITVPPHFNVDKDLPPILRKRRDWINHHLQKFSAVPELHEDFPPQQLKLRSQGKTLHITYKNSDEQGIRLEQNGDQLSISGLYQNAELLRSGLLHWIKQAAKAHFGPRLHALSQQHRLPYQRLQIRSQKSRWGSYSTSGTISLNCKLLFLPPELAEHVLLHELCHSQHLNHSAAFHQLLNSLDNNSAEYERALNEAWQYLPHWLEEA